MALSHSPKVVTSGLVLCLDAANSKSYLGSGTAWSDLSGSGNHGTLQSSPTYSSNNGGALIFNGTTQYVSSTNSSATDLTGNMTCEVWFRLTATAADWVRPFGKGDNTNRTYGLWYNTGTSTWLYQRYGATQNFQVTYSAAVSTGVWYHMVGTSSGTSHALYLNGVSVATATATGPWYSSTEGYRVGAASFHTFHNGSIAAVKLYNRGLSADEVVQNFAAQRGRYGV
jgi:hypothetical protein